MPEHGMATIWDADVLIWAASQIVDARDAGLRTSRLMAATPYEILTFIGRGIRRTRLSAPEGRARPPAIHHRRHLDPPAERAAGAIASPGSTNGGNGPTAHGRPQGIELILPDWFYAGVLDDALVLTIDRAYFDLTGGLERWLYRHRAQAWRPAARRLELRLPAPPPEVRQPLAAQALRIRAARHRPPPAAARLQLGFASAPRANHA